MASRKTSTIHQNMMMRTANRSEFDDSLLRHNQREENRLQLEIEQWEKAQRVVAKGLEKESQWFRSKLSGAGPAGPASGSYGGQTRAKKNSSETGEWAGEGRLIPDYQYRSKAYAATQPGSYADADHAQGGKQTNGESAADEEAERVTDRKRDSSKSHAHRKSSRAAKAGGEERKKKSSKSSQQHQEKTASHSRRKSSSSGSHATESKAREALTDSERAGLAHDAAAKSSKTSGAGDSDKSDSRDAAIQAAQGGGPSSRSHTKRTSAVLTSSSSASSSSTTTATTTTTAATTAPPPSATRTTKTDEPPPPPPPPAATTSVPPLLALTDASDDVPSGGGLSQRVSRDAAWDGRRRYTNVWDTLSTPKYTSTVRSVRSRLQREFSNVGDNATTSGGGGGGGGKGGPRRPSKISG